MQITEELAQTGGLRPIAQQLGVTEDQVVSGADALLPAILGGFKKQAQSSGLEGLTGMLGQFGGAAQPIDASGNRVLEQIFGSKDVSRAVATDASAHSGLDTGLLKKMLPMLTMLVTTYMAKRAGGVDNSDQGESAEGQAAEGGLGGMLTGMLGGGGSPSSDQQTGGLGSLLDLNGDGNALDDVMRMAGKFMR